MRAVERALAELSAGKIIIQDCVSGCFYIADKIPDDYGIYSHGMPIRRIARETFRQMGILWRVKPVNCAWIVFHKKKMIFETYEDYRKAGLAV